MVLIKRINHVVSSSMSVFSKASIDRRLPTIRWICTFSLTLVTSSSNLYPFIFSYFGIRISSLKRLTFIICSMLLSFWMKFLSFDVLNRRFFEGIDIKHWNHRHRLISLVLNSSRLTMRPRVIIRLVVKHRVVHSIFGLHNSIVPPFQSCGSRHFPVISFLWIIFNQLIGKINSLLSPIYVWHPMLSNLLLLDLLFLLKIT